MLSRFIWGSFVLLVLLTFLRLAWTEVKAMRSQKELLEQQLSAKGAAEAQLKGEIISLVRQLKESEAPKKQCESVSDKAREWAPRLYRRLAEATASVDERYHGVCALYENEIIILTAAHGPRICDGNVGKTIGGSVRFARYIEPLKHEGPDCNGNTWQEDAGYGFLKEQPFALKFSSEQVTIAPDSDFAYIRGASPQSLSGVCKPLRLAKSSTAAPPFIFTLHHQPYEWHLPGKAGVALKKGEILLPFFIGSPKSEQRGNFALHLLAILNGDSGMGHVNSDAEIVGVNSSSCSDNRKAICTEMIKVEAMRSVLKATWKKHQP